MICLSFKYFIWQRFIYKYEIKMKVLQFAWVKLTKYLQKVKQAVKVFPKICTKNKNKKLKRNELDIGHT